MLSSFWLAWPIFLKWELSCQAAPATRKYKIIAKCDHFRNILAFFPRLISYLPFPPARHCVVFHGKTLSPFQNTLCLMPEMHCFQMRLLFRYRQLQPGSYEKNVFTQANQIMPWALHIIILTLKRSTVGLLVIKPQHINWDHPWCPNRNVAWSITDPKVKHLLVNPKFRNHKLLEKFTVLY